MATPCGPAGDNPCGPTGDNPFKISARRVRKMNRASNKRRLPEVKKCVSEYVAMYINPLIAQAADLDHIAYGVPCTWTKLHRDVLVKFANERGFEIVIDGNSITITWPRHG